MWYRIWEGIAQQDSSGSIYGYAIFRAWFSFACGLTGRGHEARKLGEEALEFGRNHAQRLFEQMSLTALALAASLEITTDWEAVQRHMAEALEFCQKRGMRPFTGQTHYHYAELLHKKGNLPGAQGHLAQANALFREMEMTWWAEQAEALRGRLERGDPWKGLAPYAE